MRSGDVDDRLAGAFRYAEDVLDGKIQACSYVHLACRRFLDDVDRAVAGDSKWEFKQEKALGPIILSRKLPNIKGPSAGKPIALMDWQKFVLANLFGFVEAGTDARRFRQGVVYCPRGSGKTTFAAPVALYCSFVEGEGGAEGYAAAVTRDQARILFDTSKEMVRRAPDFRRQWGVETAANSIHQQRTASKFVPISSDAKALDGLNVAIAVCDEIGSHRTSEVYDVLLTAMGKRKHPLLLAISTATGNNTGIGKQLWDYSVRVLEGKQQDDRLFALIYTIDAEDDPWDEATWIKANPSWGHAVQPDAVRAIMRQARNNPAQEAAAKTRHLNVWVGADEALFSMRSWRECADLSLSMEDLEGQPCYVGVDLASKTDLAAVSVVFPGKDAEGRMTYRAFAVCFCNEAAVLEARNPSYPGWAAEGYLYVTPGNETDFGVIEDYIRELCRRFDVRQIGVDPWQAAHLSQRLMAEGAPMVEYRMQTSTLSEPTKELDAAIRSKRISHDSGPVLEWCIGNTVGHFDVRANVFPRKQRPEQKIDAAIALIVCLGLALRDADEGPSIYSSRGPLFI